MDAKELQLIKELMDQLQEEMKYGKEDFASRLGRKEEPKGIEIMKIEKSGLDELPEGDEHELKESPEFEAGEEEGMQELPESSDDLLKKRLLKLRG